MQVTSTSSTAIERKPKDRTSLETSSHKTSEDETLNALKETTTGVGVAAGVVAKTAATYGSATVSEFMLTMPASTAAAEVGALFSHIAIAFGAGLAIGHGIHKGVEAATGQTIGDHLCRLTRCDQPV